MVTQGREVLRVVDAIRILEGSCALTAEDDLAVRAWLGDRYTWLATSEAGKGAGRAKDHIGTWYVVQAHALATHLDARADIYRMCVHAKRLIAVQIGGDGRQPLEIARADGLSSSILNLEGHMHLALLASQARVDLWNHVPENGRGLKDAVDYLRPFNATPEGWPHKQSAEVAPGSLDRVLALAKLLDSMLATE